MEADDLDSLIADSLSGVQAALEGDRKAPASDARSATEAVQELRQGEAPEDFFKDLVKTFQAPRPRRFSLFKKRAKRAVISPRMSLFRRPWLKPCSRTRRRIRSRAL